MAVTEKQRPEPASTNYVDFDEFIDFQLRKTRSGIHHTDLISAGVVLLCLLTTYLLLFALFDQWIISGGFSQNARIVLLGGVILAAGGWVAWRILYPWLQSINALYAARQIEQAHPELKGSLLTWVNLRQAGKEISPSILAALEKRTAHQISNANVDEAIDRRMLMRASYVLLGLVIATCLYTLISPKKMSTTLWRALMPASSVSAATRTEIRDVKPGNTEVLARDQVDVIAELGGQIPPEVTLLFSTADRRFVNQPIRMQKTKDELPRFLGRLTGDGGKGLLSDVSYHIQAGDARSATYQIRVNQPPAAEVFEVSYEYPKYMGLSPATQPGSTIEAWEGTYVTVRARPNMPVKKARVYCSDTETATASAEEYPMTIRDDLLTARWQLKFRDDGTFARYYHVQVWNDRDQKNPQPTIARIQIRPDLKPEIKLIHPDADLSVPANSQVPIAFAARDPDFLLRKVSLKLQLHGEILPFPSPLFAAPPEMAEFKTVYRLDLSKLPLKTGDQITYWVEAEDNFEPFDKRQKNLARSQQLTLTITDPVTQEEAKVEERKQENQLQQKIQQADPNDQPENPQNQNEPRDDREQPSEPREMKEEPEQGEQGMGDDAPMPQENPADQDPAGNESGKDGQKMQPDAENQDQQNQPGQKQKQQQQGASGESSDQEASEDQQPGEKSGAGKQSNQKGTGKDGNSGPTGGKSGSDGQKQSPQQGGGKNTTRQNKAADDQALDQLLKWNDEEEQKNPGENSPQPDKGEKQSGSSSGGSGENNNRTPGSSSENAGENGDSAKPGSSESMSKENSNSQKPSGEKQNSSDPSRKDQSKNGETPPEKMNNQSSGAGEESEDRPDPGPDPRQKQDGNGRGSSPEMKKNGSGDQPQGEKNPSGATGEQGGTPGEKAAGENAQSGNSSEGKSGDANSNSPQMKQNDSSSDSAGEDSQAAPAKDGENKSGTGQSQPGKQESGTPEKGMTQKGKSGGEPQPQGDSGETAQPEPGSNGPGEKSDKPQKGNPNPAGKGNSQDSESSDSPQPSGNMKSNPGKQGQTGQNADQPGNESQDGKPTGDAEKMSNQPGQKPAGEKESAQPGKNEAPAGDQNGEKSPAQNGKADPNGKPAGGEKSDGKPDGKSDEGAPADAQKGMQGDQNKTAPRQGDAGKGDQKKQAGGKEPGSGEESGENMNGQQMEGGKQQGGKEQGQPQEGPSGDGQKEGGEKQGPSGQGKGQEGQGKEGEGQGQGKGEGQGQAKGEGKGQQGGKEGGQPNGQPNGKPGGQPGGMPSGGGSPSNGDASPDGGDGSGGDNLSAEEADLRHKKKATELALKRLRDKLERGETPEALMDQLGYTQQDLERFMQQLEQRLADPGLDQSAESAAARRQFESLLKGIDYNSSGQLREGGERERKASQSFGSGNRPAPPMYRKDSEAYKEKLNRQPSPK
ncbi:hypothetical protein SH661x_003600 [Planctomicrobium sp. SH661]|uniref:hypothetical protein n=1 Tax=Planctomicrobium sp. SH661 TaxID=3448124 RepID=UPI003F5AE005